MGSNLPLYAIKLSTHLFQEKFILNNISSLSLSQWNLAPEQNSYLILSHIQDDRRDFDWTITDIPVEIRNSVLSNTQLTINGSNLTQVTIKNSSIRNLTGTQIKLDATNCHFSSNVKHLSTNFVIHNSNATFSNNIFEKGNASRASVSFICINSSCQIVKSAFRQLRSNKNVFRAINSKANVTNCTFYNNFGGLFFIKERSSLTFTANNVTYSPSDQAFVYATDKCIIDITQCVFNNNLYKDALVNIHLNSHIKITNSIFSKNYKGPNYDHSDIIRSTVRISMNTSFEISKCTFSQNEGISGGALL